MVNTLAERLGFNPGFMIQLGPEAAENIGKSLADNFAVEAAYFLVQKLDFTTHKERLITFNDIKELIKQVSEFPASETVSLEEAFDGRMDVIAQFVGKGLEMAFSIDLSFDPNWWGTQYYELQSILIALGANDSLPGEHLIKRTINTNPDFLAQMGIDVETMTEFTYRWMLEVSSSALRHPEVFEALTAGNEELAYALLPIVADNQTLFDLVNPNGQVHQENLQVALATIHQDPQVAMGAVFTVLDVESLMNVATHVRQAWQGSNSQSTQSYLDVTSRNETSG
jgi:hypothetical protein